MAEMWLTLIWVVPLQGCILGVSVCIAVYGVMQVLMICGVYCCGITGCSDHSHDVLDVALECCVPRSVLLIYPLLLMLMMGGSAFFTAMERAVAYSNIDCKAARAGAWSR